MNARVRSSAKGEAERRRRRATAGAAQSEAYDEGRLASRSGISVQANPWPAFDPKYQQWVMGWMDEFNRRRAEP